MPLYTSLAPDNKYELVFEQTFQWGKVHIAYIKPADFDYAQSFNARSFDSAQDLGSFDSASFDSARDERIQVYLYLRENFTSYLDIYRRTMQKLP
jgi:hypothetical protein